MRQGDRKASYHLSNSHWKMLSLASIGGEAAHSSEWLFGYFGNSLQLWDLLDDIIASALWPELHNDCIDDIL